MKNHFFLILLGCLLHANFSFSQVNDRIKRESDRNQSHRNNSNSSDSNSSSSSDSDDSDFSGCDPSGCFEGCFAGLNIFEDIFKGCVAASDNIKAHELEVPDINSIELGFNTGFITPNSTLILPSFWMRGTLLSTHFRVYSNIENHIKGQNSYTTVNWQILQFNLLNEKFAHMSLGTGFLYEDYSGLFFNEFGWFLHIYPSKKIQLPFEMRVTPDYKTGTFVLFEIHTGFGYSLRQWNNSSLRLNVNYTYSCFYETVNVNAFSAGFSLHFDTGNSVPKKPVIEQ